jgi:hypothetical protein
MRLAFDATTTTGLEPKPQTGVRPAICDSPAKSSNRRLKKPKSKFDAPALLTAVEESCWIPKAKFCGSGKGSELIRAKEALILVGRKAGASLKSLADLTGISSSAVSRRHDAARRRMTEDDEMVRLTKQIGSLYENRKSQA